MRILVVAHSPIAPYGLVGRSIIEQGGVLASVMPSEGERLPDSPDGYNGLLILGGPQNAEQDDAFPHFIQLLELIRQFEKSGRPVLGICLGAQLLARAYGGKIHRLPDPEIGFTALRKTASGQCDPVFGHTADLQYLMEWHEDNFSLPPGAELLMTGDYCLNQAFRVGRLSYGVQFHPEATPEIIRGWVGLHSDYLEHSKPDFGELIETQMTRHMQDAFAYCRQITQAWLSLVQDSVE